MSEKRKALGRGLGSLLGNEVARLDEDSPEASDIRKRVQYVDLSDILPNPYQPRKTFSKDSLSELADSIREHGVLQPIILTKKDEDEAYVLLAGERRFRAAQLAELSTIPALIMEATEEEMLEIAIVENVQRNDLNPIEEAQAYRRLMEGFGWSQEFVANRVGKRRSTVANSLRLLNLNSEALKDIQDGRLTAGHARALLSVKDEKAREKLRRDIVALGLSVREAERRAIESNIGPESEESPVKKKKPKKPSGLDIVALEERLMAHLGCRVKIRSSDGVSGKLEVPFQNIEELQRFLDAVNLPD